VSGKPLFLLNRPLWLASSSRYRRELLGRLGHPFEWRAPDIDETPLLGESPKALASRLALAKAKTLAHDEPRALIIGSDQVCALGDDCLGKPASPAAQAEMLARLSGRRVTFFTAVAVVGIEAGLWQQHVDETHCEFRRLSRAEIAAYVAAEPATDCAGGFKCEGLGISLLERMHSDDPTAIIGLPLIWLARSLRPFSAPGSSSATA
jgi:septum formation protein